MVMTPLQQKFHRLIRATQTFDEDYYARANPDLRLVRDALLEHYIVQGEHDGRQPNAFFDPRWYRAQAPKVQGQDSLLAHYLTVGDRDGFQPLPGFDPAYVRAVLGTGHEPALVGFMRARRAGRQVNPSRFFDYGYYLATYTDVATSRMDGFLHFIRIGIDEGRIPAKDFSWFLLRERYQLSGSNAEAFRALMLRWRHMDQSGAAGGEAPSVLKLQEELRAAHRPSEQYEPHAAPAPAGASRAADVYAFYLTQFHRVPENDAWWGEGFTEWHNVVRGVPRFSGHYQPRIPSALGFYDLDDPNVMPRQVALARQAGLAGFAFYYYHFGDRRLLERPLDRFVADPALDTGFFLIWANETWTRRWDGSADAVLIEQKYPPDMPEKLAADLVRYFADPRYRRIDGRPLLPIYRVSTIPDARDWLRRLRAAFAALGEAPLLYLAQTFNDNDPTIYGLDGAMEFPPHKHSASLRLTAPSRLFGVNPDLKVWDYGQYVDVALAEPKPPYALIRSCFPSWDNDSRRQGASSIIHGSTPGKFREWLEALVARAEAGATVPGIVCINAWNEWGEGAYLEPDRHFGYAYLNAVQAVLRPEAGADVRRIVLVGHDAFPAGAQRLLLHLGRTLAAEFGVKVVFLLLRGDPSYDGLLPEYRAAAETIVVAGDPTSATTALAKRGFAHAIVNSAASAAVLAPLRQAEIATIQLVHELPATFATLGAGPQIGRASGDMRALVAPTRAIADMLVRAGVPEARVRIVPQGLYSPVRPMERSVARAALLGEGEERPLAVALGHGDRRKGLDLFVATAEASLREERGLLFLWQGDWEPELASALAQRIEPLLQAGILRHLPDDPEIDALLGAADAYLLCSREDPLPSSAIEAWSVGLPVVAISGTGGIADLIAGDPNLGRLASNEAPEALLAALDLALVAGRSGERATWAAETFDWPRYVGTLLRELYAPPLLDVAIIGHNHGRFAEPRLQSIARQTLPPRRVTYHDIASTDGSLAALRTAARRTGAVVREEAPNEGRLYETWRALAAAADATYIHLAEGDDWIAPTMLARCVGALEGQPDAAYAFVGVEWVDEADALLADHLDYPASVIGAGIGEGGPISPETVLGSDMVVKNPVLTISSVVWRRAALLALLEENAGDLAKLDFAFDWLLYLRAARAGWAALFVPERLCRHRQHAESFASRDNMARHATEIAAIYGLEPAPEHGQRRADYLASLV